MNKRISILAVIGLFIAALAYAQPASITFECHNPSIPLKFVYNQLTSKGKGQASSQKVQFNIYKEPAKGTIRVDDLNNGICTATITSNHKITTGRAVFDPSGSYTENSTNPNLINSSVTVSTSITSNKEVVFSVARSGNHSGNVTLTFFVEYEEAQ
jgi:hypothetical protein